MQTNERSKCESLTEAQKECLRLVYQGYKSKQIAQFLSVTSFAIDERLKRAMQTLGASDRNDAARMLAQYEGNTYQRLVCQSPDVASLPDSAPAIAPSEDAGKLHRPMQKLGWILLVAIGSAIAFGGIVSGLEALTRIS